MPDTGQPSVVADRTSYFERPVPYHARQVSRMHGEPYGKAQSMPKFTSRHDDEGGALTTPRAANRAIQAWMQVLESVVAQENCTHISLLPSPEICSILRLVENELKYSEPISPGWTPLSRWGSELPGGESLREADTSLSASLATTRSFAGTVTEAGTACFDSEDDDEAYDDELDPLQEQRTTSVTLAYVLHTVD